MSSKNQNQQAHQILRNETDVNGRRKQIVFLNQQQNSDVLIVEIPENCNLLNQAHIDGQEDHYVPEEKTPNEQGFFLNIIDGVFELRLRPITIVSSLLVDITMLWMLWGYCHMPEPDKICRFDKWPMISIVIQENMYKCIFIYMTTMYMFGIMQANMRAFYKKMQGVISQGLNNFMFFLAITSCFIMPLIALFDRQNYGMIHIFCAYIFCIFFGLYVVLLSRSMYANKNKYPVHEEKNINFIYYNSCGVAFIMSSFNICYMIYGESYISPFMQWLIFFYTLNFFAILNINNDFVDSIQKERNL
eukprot:403377438